MRLPTKRTRMKANNKSGNRDGGVSTGGWIVLALLALLIFGALIQALRLWVLAAFADSRRAEGVCLSAGGSGIPAAAGSARKKGREGTRTSLAGHPRRLVFALRGIKTDQPAWAVLRKERDDNCQLLHRLHIFSKN